MIRRTVQEWGRLGFGAGEREIPEWAAERLARAALGSDLGGHDGNRIVTLGRKELRAGQVVGILAAEGCVLEILPKIDGLEPDGLRRRLVHMLGVAFDIDVSAGRLSAVDWQRRDLLEIVIGLFARKLADSVRRGMPRLYVGNQDDLPALRGRLNVTRQFTALAASPQILACRYDELSSDIALNQIMRAAVHRLLRFALASDTQRMLRELAFVYMDVADVPVAALRWSEVVLDRTNARWAELLALAGLLLEHRYQTTSMGDGQGFSLLFEMNVLFEEYIARMLARALGPDGFTVAVQGGRLHCLTDCTTGDRRFQTKPDLVIRKSGSIAMVGDTKWKRLAPRSDDPKHGISQADVYQMMAYAQIYGCARLLLLYPHHRTLGAPEGILGRYSVTGSAAELNVATIDVGRGDAVSARLRALALEAM